MQLNFNKLFPASDTGSQGPLPKQLAFMQAALPADPAKYVSYVGGIGSGKTLIGCIVTLMWAVLYQGDYLIARQYSPEMKVTTYKTFRELIPAELLIEERVADGIFRIRCRSGGVSNVIFRPLEEPDKLRSMNLSGAYIDEASQVSEYAFMLLQGRMRGKGPRKIILTSNPNGHDWIYRWWVKQDFFTNPATKELFRLIKAPSTENIHLPPDYVRNALATWSEDRVRREIYADFDSFEGQVYSEFRHDVHVVKPFPIPAEWTRVMGADHGYRNAAAFLWGAVDYDGNIYVYKEFYQREWLVEEIVKGKGKQPGVLSLNGKDKVQVCAMDPSTRATRGMNGKSDWDAYLEHLPERFPLSMANRDVTSGIDRVKSYLKVNLHTGKPRIFIFHNCVNLIDEMSKYRYAELTGSQQGKVAEKEEPVKVNDHACDALRYLIMTQPDPPKDTEDVYKRIKYTSLEGSVYRELQKHKTPVQKDPFSES